MSPLSDEILRSANYENDSGEVERAKILLQWAESARELELRILQLEWDLGQLKRSDHEF